MTFLIGIVDLALQVLILLVIVKAVLSWFPTPPYHPAVKMLDSIVEPLLKPLRKMGRSVARGFDLSPMILILVLMVLQQIIRGLPR